MTMQVRPGQREVADERGHLRRLGRGHAAGRLVQQQQRRGAHQRSRQFEPALIGQRQAAREHVPPVREADRVEQSVDLLPPCPLGR